MSVRKMDIETLLEVVNADRLVLCFGNKETTDPFLELELHRAVARDGRITYSIVELSETGMVSYPMASPLQKGVTMGEISKKLKSLNKKISAKESSDK